MPADRATPNDWLANLDGAPGLDMNDDRVERLTDGQIVKFTRRFDYGETELHVDKAGIRVDQPMPAGADQCCVLDGLQAETLADSVEEMIKLVEELDLPEDSYRVTYYRFESALPFRFDAATKSFQPVNG
jgi:hypothetical protein